jgi:hypothetical protein
MYQNGTKGVDINDPLHDRYIPTYQVTNFNLGGEVVSSLGLILMGGNPPIKKEVTILTDCHPKANKKSDEIYFFLRLSISAQ